MAGLPIEEVEPSNERRSRMSGILWGLSKCGKTTLLTSLPGKKLFVMLDPDGDQSVPDREDVFILPVYRYSDAEIVRWTRDKLPSMLKANKEQYNSCIVDSISSFYLSALNHAIDEEVGASKKDGFIPSIEAPGLGAYGARGNYTIDMVQKVLRATANSGMHCFFTAHEDTPDVDLKGNFLGISPTLSGKTTNGVGLAVSEIWHLRADDGKRTLSIAPCRSRKPMGSRIFTTAGSPEFLVDYDITGDEHQVDSIATWFGVWEHSGRQKLPLPDTDEFDKLYAKWRASMKKK